MPDRRQDAAFRQFVAAERAELLAVAYLVFGSRARGEDVVEASLAWLYGHWPDDGDPRTQGLRRVVHADPRRLVAPWQHRERVELIDRVSEPEPTPPGAVTDLAGLDADGRRVVVLERLVGLGLPEIAAVLGASAEQVGLWSTEATAGLVRQDPRRAAPGELTRELRSAHPYRPTDPDAATVADDLARGRLLVRRRSLRRSIGVVAAVVLGVLGLTQVVSVLQPAPSSAQSAASTAPPVAPTCDVSQTSCRAGIVGQWRSDMSKVVGSYVDPERRYFSGYTFSKDPLYDSAGFWEGRGGALGLDLFRLREGSTEIYLQIASSKELALPCGRLTRQSCDVLRFMDANVFTLSDSTRLADGLEVQYSPNGDQVITVVARNRSKGRELDVTRADLIALVQDERLRLPSR